MPEKSPSQPARITLDEFHEALFSSVLRAVEKIDGNTLRRPIWYGIIIDPAIGLGIQGQALGQSLQALPAFQGG